MTTTTSTSSGVRSGLVLHLSRSQAVTNVAFAAAEKQVILEVAAPGTAKGFSGFQEGDGVEHWCWDNIHWWGSRANEQMISAPGAFHAAHVHWRWGAAAIPTFSKIPVVEGTGRPSGLPRGTGTTSGTLLVDPRIWIQSIRVAVTENDPLLDPDRPGVALEGLCKVDWKSLFTGLRAAPREIAAGADIVCWYSAEVHRDITLPRQTFGVNPGRGPLPEPVPLPPLNFTNKLEGTVMLHGIFFAHEPETTTLETGTTHPEHWPRTAAEIRSRGLWVRDAT